MRTPEERRLNPWTDAQCLDYTQVCLARKSTKERIYRLDNGAVYHLKLYPTFASLDDRSTTK